MARQDGGRRGTSGTRIAEVPDKLCFRIGEVARICAVPSYVLRFWEREFPQLRPAKGGTGQRLYRRRDVEMALRVRHLLYEEGYTIPGARQWLREGNRGAGTERSESGVIVAAGDGTLSELRSELEAIVRLLASGERGPAAARAEARRPGGRTGSRAMEPPTMPLFAQLENSVEEERGR